MAVNLQTQSALPTSYTSPRPLFLYLPVELHLEHRTDSNHGTTDYIPGSTYPRSESSQSSFTSRELQRKAETASLPAAVNPLDRGRRLTSSTPRVLPFICRRGRWKFTDRKKHHGAGLRGYEISVFLFPFRGATFFFPYRKKNLCSCYGWKR